MKKICVFIILLCCCFHNTVFSEEIEPIISVLDFETSDISESDMKGIISRLSSTLFQTGKFQVIDISQREAILKEMEFSMSGCADNSCMLEVGKMLSAEAIVVGTISNIDSVYFLSSKMLETETGKILNTADGTYNTISDLLSDLSTIAAKLAGLQANDFIVNDDSKEEKKVSSNTGGWIFSASAVVCLGGGITLALIGNSFLQTYIDALAAYDNAVEGDDFLTLRQTRDTAYNEAVDANAELLFYSGLGFSGAGIILGVLAVVSFLSQETDESVNYIDPNDNLSSSGHLNISVFPGNNNITVQGSYSY